MESTIQVLVVGSDPSLPSEFEAALRGVAGWRVVPYFAQGHGQAIEIALSRNPRLICIELGNDIASAASLARELHRALPHSAVAALYRRDLHGGEEPESSVIIELLRARVQDFLRRPLASTELRDLLDRVLQPRAAQAPARGKVITFTSNKGGVGKSTLSVNTACELASRHPGRAVLIDASLQLGVCAIMLGMIPETSIVDAVRERDRLDDTLLRQLAVAHPCGLHLLSAPADAVQASEVDDQSFARVINLARRAFDYVIIDTFPMLDGIVMAALDLSDIAFVVLQGTVPNVVGAARLLPVLDSIGLARERTRVIVNQNYASFSGDLALGDVERRLGRPIDYAIPYHKRLMPAMNTGSPYILRSTKWFGFGRAIKELATEIEGIPAEGSTRGSTEAQPEHIALSKGAGA